MIKVASFGILISVKSSCFYFYFFKRLSRSHVLQHWICFWLSCPRLMTKDASLIGWSNWLSFFLIDFFFSISSFNIVFDWELDFMIYFGLIFMRLFWPHNLGIMFNGLSHIILTWLIFCVIFLIKIFINFIVNIGSDKIDWELSFVICFYMLIIGLSQSHVQSCRFGKLIQVILGLFLFYFYEVISVL